MGVWVSSLDKAARLVGGRAGFPTPGGCPWSRFTQHLVLSLLHSILNKTASPREGGAVGSSRNGEASSADIKGDHWTTRNRRPGGQEAFRPSLERLRESLSLSVLNRLS